MKKWKRVAGLALAVMLAGGAAAYASNGNAVVSLSYLQGTFWESLGDRLKDKTEPLEGVYTEAEQALKEKLGQEPGEDKWLTTTAFETVYPQAGETVTLGAGSGCVWLSGVGAASDLLVDVTAGEELAPGQSLVAGHRYLAESETVITAVSASACSAEGVWMTTATGEAPVALPFTDVAEGAWYYGAVAYAVERGLFNGTTPTTFEPNTTMNRAMLVTVLHRVAGEPAIVGEPVFADVKSGEWFAPGVIWASGIGVVNGMSETEFGPYGTVTREQIAVLLHRFAGYLGCDVSARASLSGFGDQSEVSGYALEGMSWAVAVGLMQGSDGLLDPTGGATRAQVATLMQRFESWMAAQ